MKEPSKVLRRWGGTFGEVTSATISRVGVTFSIRLLPGKQKMVLRKIGMPFCRRHPVGAFVSFSLGTQRK
ncbi:hypothetical protein [Membranihabitans maritimus]|uniref:hypothetical protein n=1 Tax=Membranihabitans maritimus TaxID=2904244 RepID=UPI001F3BA962|nr:hypothetical protein [Membranihabitans maritimus]